MAIVSLSFSYRGYDNIGLSIEGESGQDALRKLQGAIDYLEKMGATPSVSRPGGEVANDGPPICPDHNKPMKRSKHFNGWYCSRKTDSGEYCTQQVKD